MNSKSNSKSKSSSNGWSSCYQTSATSAVDMTSTNMKLSTEIATTGSDILIKKEIEEIYTVLSKCKGLTMSDHIMIDTSVIKLKNLIQSVK